MTFRVPELWTEPTPLLIDRVVAFCELQVSVELSPTLILVGLAVMLTVGPEPEFEPDEVPEHPAYPSTSRDKPQTAKRRRTDLETDFGQSIEGTQAILTQLWTSVLPNL